MKEEMDLYTDYLLSSFGQVTATGLSNLLDNSVSHDKITRLLSGNIYSSKDLWQEAKPLVGAHERDERWLRRLHICSPLCWLISNWKN
jgi:hypothetical protein